MSHYFDLAFSDTMEIEGKLSNDEYDPGGMTFFGISRVYWPEWEGWPAVDLWVMNELKDVPQPLYAQVKKFYRVNFWNLVRGNDIAALAPEIAYEIFDTAVNTGVYQAVMFLQIAHNVSRGNYFNDLLVDGIIGPKTLGAIKKYLDSAPGTKKENIEILFNCMNGEQYIYYKGNPKRKRYRGWFRRV